MKFPNTLTHMHIYTNIHKYRHIQIHENKQYKDKYTHMLIYTHKHQYTGKHSLRHNCIHILSLFYKHIHTDEHIHKDIHIVTWTHMQIHIYLHKSHLNRHKPSHTQICKCIQKQGNTLSRHSTVKMA